MRTPTERIRAEIEKVTEQISPTNLAFSRRIITLRLNAGGPVNTTLRYAHALRHADRALPAGATIEAATADAWVQCFQNLRSDPRLGASTIHGISTCLRAVLRSIHGKNLPKALNNATYVRRPPRTRNDGRLLTDADFFRLLDTAKHSYARLKRLPAVEMTQALLWALWDSGFRAGELLSLCVNDVKFDEQGGARLILVDRPSMPALKTGPRTVYVVECVGPLKAWLALHPAGTDGAAPLWTGIYDQSGYAAMTYETLHKIISGLGRRAGITANSGRGKGLSPHDFRHTRATRAARANWPESKMRVYFGWSPTSDEAATYIHLAQGDLKEQVRRDAGIDGEGYRAAADRGDDVAALAELLQRALQRNQGTTTATRRRATWELP